MSDLRLNAYFFEHHKTVKLQRLLGSDGVLSIMRLWAFCAKTGRDDGDLAGMDDEDIAIAAGWIRPGSELVSALEETGFLDGSAADETGLRFGSGADYRIHDFAEHQPWLSGRPGRRKAAQLANNIRWHNRGAHDDRKNGCPLCSESDPNRTPLLSDSDPLRTKPESPTSISISTTISTTTTNAESGGETGENHPVEGAPREKVTHGVKPIPLNAHTHEQISKWSGGPIESLLDLEKAVTTWGWPEAGRWSQATLGKARGVITAGPIGVSEWGEAKTTTDNPDKDVKQISKVSFFLGCVLNGRKRGKQEFESASSVPSKSSARPDDTQIIDGVEYRGGYRVVRADDADEVSPE